MQKTFIGITFFILMLSFVAKGQEIRGYKFSTGTLERLEPPNGDGYLFVSNGTKEMFSIGPEGGVGKVSRGIADLVEVGFRMANGKRYFLFDEKGRELQERAAKENPGMKADAILFRGEAGSLLEVFIDGKTPVHRIDLIIGERGVTLWANVEGKGDDRIKSK